MITKSITMQSTASTSASASSVDKARDAQHYLPEEPSVLKARELYLDVSNVYDDLCAKMEELVEAIRSIRQCLEKACADAIPEEDMEAMVQEEEALMAQHAKDIVNLEHAADVKALFKRRYRRACWKANRKTRKAAEREAQTKAEAEADAYSDSDSVFHYYVFVHDADSDADSDADATEHPEPKPLTEAKEVNYHEAVKKSWQSQNSTYYTTKKYFRRFAVVGGKANFQVAKDGACYEGLGLDVDGLSVAELKRWASVLQVPYASKMRRAELVEVLQPVLEALASGPARRW